MFRDSKRHIFPLWGSTDFVRDNNPQLV